ncbi:MAG: mechanosensitive ion channel family protein, partial [Pseudomonadota bacterium]|nr:mechanosensitive ion channel family protein [Pseudomonadota bacterium]
MNNTIAAAAAAAPRRPLTTETVQGQAHDFYVASTAWLQTHWLQILIAIGAGIAIFLALHFVKSLGNRLCNRDTNGTGWGT